MRRKFYKYQDKEYTIEEICKIANISRRWFDELIKKGLSVDEIVNKAIYRGMSRTRLYRTYYNIIQRCYNPKDKDRKHYQDKGINVCDEWLNDNKAFFDWALSNGYADNLTIDRIDNNKGYSPDNCRWVDQSTQNENKETSFRLLYNNEWKTLREIALIEGISWRKAKWRYVECEKTRLPIKYLYERS